MARKSKGFSELLHQKQDYEQAAASSFKRLQEKVKKSSGAEVSQNMVSNPTGIAKMSEILEKFIDPYKETTQDFAEVECLLSMAVIAWNIALLPKVKRKDAIEHMLSEIASGPDQEIREDLQNLFDELIERKDNYFSAHDRFISNFDLKERGSGYFLSVASTLEE